MPTVEKPSDAPSDLVSFAIMLCAGPIAETRCLQGGTPGWRRVRLRDEIVSYHEAGHAVARRVLSKPVYSVSIVPVEANGRCIAGHVRISPPENEVTLGPPDGARVIEIIRGLARDRQTRLALARLLREQAEAFVSKHWRQITSLAAELERHKTLDGPEIDRILAPFIQAAD